MNPMSYRIKAREVEPCPVFPRQERSAVPPRTTHKFNTTKPGPQLGRRR